ncbi:hypothetical protein OPV22_007447 [Ensete ventricosum]|uniref:Uncharacterized protein n=1 Tax=Ensete ventricosum TaxID=4639 RepID=A0AAV8Q8M0_ENSVE|nr:hypothetical protein OPV22_007447 [Ensete ventricosum]
MEFFAGARVVRWQSIHNKYPVAEDDERRESQHQDRSSSGGPGEGRRLGKLVRGDCATEPEALSDSSEEDEAEQQ